MTAARVSTHIADLWRDIGYGLRRIIKAPGFAAVGIVSLAIGIGLCSLVFAQLSALMLRPLPGATDPTGLVSLQRPVPYPFFESYRDESTVTVAAAAFIGPVPFGVAIEGAARDTQRVFGHLVSPEYFSTVGVVPQFGRVFSPDTERPGSEAVMVVSDRFWRTRLDSDPQVVGRVLQVNGEVVTVVGVGPEDFLGVYPSSPADLFIPVTVPPTMAPELDNNALNNRELYRFRVVLRLATGVTTATAETGLDVMTRALEADDPDPGRDREGRQTSLLSAEGLMFISDEQRTLTLGSNVLLLGLLLTIVCGNLATLLLARASSRRREVAIRLSLGAGRFRLVRQLVTESVVIALAGGAVGIVLAFWLIRVTSAFTPATGMPFEFDMRVDVPVLAFTCVVSVLCGVGFGLLPAIVTSRTPIAGTLKGGDLAPLRRYRRFGLRNILVVYQVAGALTLLLVTGWVVLGYQRSASIDPGFDTTGLSLLNVDPPRDGLGPARAAELLDRLQERLPQLPEVRSLTLAMSPPFADLAVAPDFRVSVAAPGSEMRVQHTILRRRVGTEYFATLGIPVVQGREIDDRDQRYADALRSTGEIPVVLNQTAAERLFPNGPATDQRFQAVNEVFSDFQLVPGAPTGPGIDPAERRFVVIGVVQDVKSAFMNAQTVPTMFWPINEASFARSAPQGVTMALRAEPGRDAVSAARRELTVLFPDLTLFNVRTMDEHVNQFNTMLLFSSIINGGIGVFALILASIGLAGVTTHAVSRRRKEIGIRIALGARARQILRLVLTESLVLVVVGGVLGFAGAAALARAFSAVAEQFARLFAVGAGDPMLLVGAPALLALLTVVACYLPARRSTRVDPLLALREE